MERALDRLVERSFAAGRVALQEGAHDAQVFQGLGAEDVEQLRVGSEQAVVVETLLGGR